MEQHSLPQKRKRQRGKKSKQHETTGSTILPEPSKSSRGDNRMNKPPKKRGRKPAHLVPEDSGSNTIPSGMPDVEAGYRPGARRQVQLARNRVAATKCRLKKRDELSRLAAHEQEMEEEHAILIDCYEGLRNEVIELKCQVLQHANCECVLVQRYLAEEARKVVERHEQGAPSPDYTLASNSSPSAPTVKIHMESPVMAWNTTFPSLEGNGLDIPDGLDSDAMSG